MGKLILYTKKEDGSRVPLATVYVRDNQVVVEAETDELKYEIKEIIHRAIKENKVIKRVIRKPILLRYFGGAPPEELSEELRKELKEAYEDLPVKPSDPEFLRCLRNYDIWVSEKPGGYRVYTKYLEK